MLNKKGFTIIELLIVILMLGVGLIGVFQTVGRSYNFLSNIRAKLVAINFARGGMEGVFTIRNTNWQRWGGKKDQCWLKINPLVDSGANGCQNDTWFGSGSYVLDITGTQQYFYLKKEDNPLDLKGKLVSNDWNYLLCKDPNDGLIKACHGVTSRPTNYFSPELYFRQVRGGYLLDKNDGSFMTCSKGTDTNCGNGVFEEKNFCVDVMYFNGTKKHVTFCSVMTNFKE